MNRLELLRVNAINIAAIAGAFTLENFSRLATIGLCVSGIAYNIFKIRAERRSK